MSKVILITGAARGMGVQIARRALDAGHRVIATARTAEKVHAVLGKHENLLAASLDITQLAMAEAVVESAIERAHRRADQQRGNLPSRLL